ncbi:hypothetical protein [Candidatus Ichthyocystis sparus]|uniref:hypothetical protein n=1 Tax=Candidatus Ichthyocystis sparus TaxID=1561004 RepID=UPI0011463950|nr:hypothetical protein [Candidatus Ichthyocystis sparus]
MDTRVSCNNKLNMNAYPVPMTNRGYSTSTWAYKLYMIAISTLFGVEPNLSLLPKPPVLENLLHFYRPLFLYQHQWLENLYDIPDIFQLWGNCMPYITISFVVKFSFVSPVFCF